MQTPDAQDRRRPSRRLRLAGLAAALLIVVLVGLSVQELAKLDVSWADITDSVGSWIDPGLRPLVIVVVALLSWLVAGAWVVRRLVVRMLTTRRRLRVGSSARVATVGLTGGTVPSWATVGGVTLVVGPVPAPMDELQAAATSQGARLVVVGEASTLRHLAEVVDPADALIAPADLAAVRARILASPVGRATVVLADGSQAFGGRALAERPEAHLCWVIDELRPTLARTGAALVVRSSLEPRAVFAPDAVGARLVGRLDAARLWAGGRFVPPGPSDGTLSWWVARRNGVDVLGPAGARISSRVSWAVTAVMCVAAALLAAFPGFGDDATTTTLIGSIDHDLGGSLWLNWWVLGWIQGDHGLWTTEMLYWPAGAPIGELFGNIFVAFLAAPFEYFGGYPGYWNSFVLALLTANGLAAAALARQIGISARGMLVVAVGFTVAPPILRDVNNASPSVVFAAPFVIALALGLRALDGRRPADGWWTGLWVALAGMTWWAYGALAALILLPLGLSRARREPDARPLLWAQLGATSRIVLPSLLLALPLLATANRGDVPGLTWLQAPFVTDKALPHVDVVFAESVERSLTPWLALTQVDTSSLALLGGVGVVLAGWWLLPVGRRGLWGGLAVVSALLACGYYVDASSIAEGLLPLPLGLLGWFVPLVTALHQPDRLMIPGALALLLVLGLVLQSVTASWSPGWRTAGAVVALVVAAATPWLTGTAPVATYRFSEPMWVKMLPGGGAIVSLPLGGSDEQLVYQPLHGHPIVGGPGVYRRLLKHTDEYRTLLSTDSTLAWMVSGYARIPIAEETQLLYERGLHFVVVRTDITSRIRMELGSGRALEAWSQATEVDRALGPPNLDVSPVKVYALSRLGWTE